MNDVPEPSNPNNGQFDHATNAPQALTARQSIRVGGKFHAAAYPSNGLTDSSTSGQAEGTDAPHLVRGHKPGDRYVRIHRPGLSEVRQIDPTHVQISEEELAQRGGAWRQFKNILLGKPIATARAGHERLGKIQALAIFASDALSSVAYATEATLFVLVVAFTSATPTQYVIPISIMICLLIGLVVNSYRQTVHAYPGGGGSYIVTKDNLGVNLGLVAAAAILIDYILTVAVSVAAGVAAIISAFPALNGYQVPFGVAVILLLTVANLRGVRESGVIFALPTYVFIFSFLGLLAYGTYRIVTGDFTAYPTSPLPPATSEIHGFNTEAFGLFLLLQAFAAGCSALTGVEAISDGVQAFKKPEAKNASITLLAMGGLLILFFMGTSFLAFNLHAMPSDPNHPQYQTVISAIGRNLLGDSVFYYIIQFSTSLILLLAANTAFADFPRLSFFLARDRFLPNIFAHRGDRLAYSTGIIVLAVLASILLAVFNGHTESLIPLYAVGVFLAFTLSQSGMVVHWQRKKREGMRGVTRSQFFNLVGAIATGIVLTIIVITKFSHGAWLVVILIPLLFLMFKGIARHYTRVADSLRLPATSNMEKLIEELPVNGTRERRIIVPISRINKISLSTLDFARSLGDDVTALFISDEPEAIEEITRRWKKLDISLPLVIVENPYRSIVQPLLNYLTLEEKAEEGSILMLVLPEFVTRKWWQQFLHNQTALRIKSALLFRPGVVVVDVPYQIDQLRQN